MDGVDGMERWIGMMLGKRGTCRHRRMGIVSRVAS